MNENDERLARLESQVSSLLERIAALEASEPKETKKQTKKRPASPEVAPGEPDLGLLERLQGRTGAPYEEDDERGAILYAGSARFNDRSYVWQIERPVPGLLGVEEEALTPVISALASPSRLQLLKAMLRGASGAQQLQQELGDASVGQFYHHLKELQAAGLIAQKRRGSYEIKTQSVVPLLAILAAAYDLADHRQQEAGEASEVSANEG